MRLLTNDIHLYTEDDLEQYGADRAANARAEMESEVEMAHFTGFARGVVMATLGWLVLGIVLK